MSLYSKRDGKNGSTKRVFADYEKDVKAKKKGKPSDATPSIIQIQRMLLNKGKNKYISEYVRENVDFSEYTELNLKNIKLACEAAFSAPPGSCDVLVTTSGPIAIEDWQIHRKTFYLIHFKTGTGEDDDNSQQGSSRSTQVHSSSVDQPPSQPSFLSKGPLKKPEKSVSIIDILRASKLKKPVRKSVYRVALERFLVTDGGSWEVEEEVNVVVEEEQVDDGGFRNCFNCTIGGERWMLKRLKQYRIEEAKEVNLSDEGHTRKQVQMHMVARELVAMFNAEFPPSFGETFAYDEIFFAVVDGRPATLERFIDGQCVKYVNNNGICPNPEEGMEELFEKAQALAHYTWRKSGKKLILLDIQGAGFQLYDPEIATPVAVTVTEDQNESTDLIEFCMGNMSLEAIKMFINKEHKCGKWCEMMKLTTEEKKDDTE